MAIKMRGISARYCNDTDPPIASVFIDEDWHRKNRVKGSKVYYNCPWMRATAEFDLTGTF